MPIVQNSTKFATEQQYIVFSQSVVFFRVTFETDGYKMMTATAGEDTVGLRAYDVQDRLMSSTLSVLGDIDCKSVQKEDHAERPYIEARGFSELLDIKTVATRVLDSLGFDDIGVRGLQEMRAIYDELSIDGSGEDVYLSDGIWVTSNGDLISR